MSLIYDGKQIIPAPLINIKKIYNKSGDGGKQGVLYNLVLRGTLLPFRGSPSGNYTNINNAFSTSGTPADEPFATNGEDFNHILRKQEALRFLFKNDGKSLEWQPCGGQPVVKCNPRVIAIDFDEGQWTNRSDYSIELETDIVNIVGLASGEDSFDTQFIQSAQEDWRFEENTGFDGDTYRVSHIISAQGILSYDANGDPIASSWEHAKSWCEARASGVVDPVIMLATINVNNWNSGSFTRSVNLVEDDGSYSITESWVLAPSGSFIDKRFSFSKSNNEGAINVSYKGTIFGIANGQRMGNQAAIDNAKLDIPSDSEARIEASGAVSEFMGSGVIPVSPSEKNIGINQKDGTVSFSFAWNTDESEDDTFTRTCEASIVENNETTISLTCSIEGKGSTSEERLTNAKNAIPTDTEALVLASGIINEQIPSGITIGSEPQSKSIAINETAGSIRAAYSWNTFDASGLEGLQITVQTILPKDISATILIPGRVNGPIFQDMGTQSGTIITVTLQSANNNIKPNNATIVALMNTNAEADFSPGDSSSWFLDNDQESFSVTDGNYSRTRTYKVK